jgi:hypothetical protein
MSGRLATWLAALLGLLFVGCAVLARGEPSAVPMGTLPALPSVTPHVTPGNGTVDTLQEARDLVEFRVQAPTTVPPTFEFYQGRAREMPYHGAYLELVYRPVGGQPADQRRHSILITQSQDLFTTGDPSTPITIQGVTGQIVHGGDIGNPGLVAILWQKDGLSFSIVTRPTETFTEQDLIAFVDSFE